MTEFISIRNQSCPNDACGFYGQVVKGNVVVHSRRYKRYKCKACGKTWVAYRDHVRYGLRTDFEKVKRAFELAQRGESVREVAEQIAVSPSTVQRWKARLKAFA